MRVLVLGGSLFLGRHVVEAALAAGHEVTLFHRGKTQPELFPEVERVLGDRDGGLGALAGRRWDSVIDTCGFVPRVVAQSVRLPVDRYVFVSTVSVYADLTRPPDEQAAVRPEPDHEDVRVEYGGLKAACERVVREACGERAIVVRPGLIGGPHDPTGRFTYWPQRIVEGGTVLAPSPSDAPVQVIDVRDLAAWLVELAVDAAGSGGPRTYNAVGEAWTLGALLDALVADLSPDARLAWASPDALEGVTPWSELPLWIPDADSLGMMRIDPAAALRAGLRRRPILETARDTLAWARELGGAPPRQADGRYAPVTLTREKERAVLARLRG
jgi:2'-hydroxyisoflavone reductase